MTSHDQAAAFRPQGKPAQQQEKQPGETAKMQPRPDVTPRYRGADKLKGKVALITGGDSGIGQAVAVAFAREGADVAIVYLDEHNDARQTIRLVEAENKRCIAIAGDIAEEAFCQSAVEQTVKEFGHLEILVNNAAEQHMEEPETVSKDELERVFATNIFSFFYMTKESLPHLKQGSAIINSGSVVAYKGNPKLLTYAATKGAIITFTRSLAKTLVERGIRVNAVAPGPIWTPLIPSSYNQEKVESFGKDTPMKRAGQPNEVAPAYVYLASLDGSYVTGQVIHVNGGDVVGS